MKIFPPKYSKTKHRFTQPFAKDQQSAGIQFSRTQEKYCIIETEHISSYCNHSFKLMESFEYKFNGEREQYEIFISKIFAPSNTLDKSAIQHNQEVGNSIEQYKKKVEWGSTNVRENRQSQPEQKIHKKTTIKYSFIVMKLKYRNYHGYYCQVVGENEKRTFYIGHKNTISMYPQEEDDIETLDGYISCQNEIWKIKSFESEYNDRNIWTKIPAKYDDNLSPRQKYWFRLAQTASFFLQFKNLQP